MSINFHDPNLSHTYVGRIATESWREWVRSNVKISGRKVLDLGCGGGIYSRALAELGASEVLGMDFSESMLQSAKEHSSSEQSVEYRQIHFEQGNALETGLPAADFDLILQRALIHHLTELDRCFHEAYRLLSPGGLLMIQDRTPEDCLLPGSSSHIRGYFFEKFPRLAAKEISRRHDGTQVRTALEQAGFERIREASLWEIRQQYTDVQELREDLLSRKGRSILHELNEGELVQLADYVEKKLATVSGRPIVEQDRWTIWLANKKGGENNEI